MLLLVINQKPLARLQASHLSSVGYPQTFCHNLKEYSHFFGQVDQNVLSLKSLVAQSCPTLCDSIDGSPLGSSVPGILQARILEWVAISFSNA